MSRKVELVTPIAHTMITGADLMRNPKYNKGLSFTEEERQYLRLEGLLPAAVLPQDTQVERVLSNLRRKTSPLEKYIFLQALQDRNEHLFFRVLVDHIMEIMPIVYTPTVGLACQEYGHIFRRPRGLFISLKHRGRILDILKNWPEQKVKAIVVTDGERILGLGDLGAYGMGIPVGKLALYTACAGIRPCETLPITLDVGTNNKTLLDDPMYIGLRQNRLSGEEYDSFIEEFILAVREWYGPTVLVQFEDFGNHNAFRLLEKYRNRICTFNDDIQGTSAVTLAGIYGALRITQTPLDQQRFLIVGAGEAGIGIAELITYALHQEFGLTEEEARKKCWFVDSKGLVVSSRTDLTPQKRLFAQDMPHIPVLADVVPAVRPTALIGVSAQKGVFTQEVLERVAECVEQPIVFALSNPTSKAECTAEEAYQHTKGRAIFASGSPFDPVVYGDRTFVPGQGNNSYIFPGVGLGVIAAGSLHVTDEMFYVSAKELAKHVTDSDLAKKHVYPPLEKIREVSAHIGAAVADVAYNRSMATLLPKPEDMLSYVRSIMYHPDYPSYVSKI